MITEERPRIVRTDPASAYNELPGEPGFTDRDGEEDEWLRRILEDARLLRQMLESLP